MIKKKKKRDDDSNGDTFLGGHLKYLLKQMNEIPLLYFFNKLLPNLK